MPLCCPVNGSAGRSWSTSPAVCRQAWSSPTRAIHNSAGSGCSSKTEPGRGNIPKCPNWRPTARSRDSEALLHLTKPRQARSVILRLVRSPAHRRGAKGSCNRFSGRSDESGSATRLDGLHGGSDCVRGGLQHLHGFLGVVGCREATGSVPGMTSAWEGHCTTHGKHASVSPGVAVSDEGELIAGRYRLISRLGSGAMGVVWQAQDERLHRTVAIKQLLLPSGMGHVETDEANRRALREGRITARLHHPHAIAVYDVAEHEGQPYLIMEYLPSSSLATVLSVQGVLLPDKVARIGSQVASALAAAHAAGIVHRDIKPGNVLLADDGMVKITDFGISHAVGDVTVTATGILTGTPAYLAPEVAQGGSADFPSDVFSLGSTLYTALEGMPPFGLDNNAIALLHRVALGEIIPPRQSGPLTPLLLRLLHRNPEQRPTMHQAADLLATLAADLAMPRGSPPAATRMLSRDDLTVPKPAPPERVPPKEV